MEQFNLYMALGGLLLLTLVTASLFKRYQERMAEKRRRILRVLRGVDMIERILFRLGDFPLPPEVERLLREDVANRYRKVKAIHARYAGIDESIANAEAALGQPRMHGEMALHEGEQLRGIIGSLNEIVATRRAEVVYRYHKKRAEELDAQGLTKQAAKHCQSIRSYLYEHGPTNDQVKQWYEEADQLRKGYEVVG